MVAPFVHRLLRALTQSPSLRSIIMDVTAPSAAALYDACFFISDLPQAIPAYIVLLLRAFTINALNHVTQRLTLDSLSPDILRLSSSWPRLYLPFLSMPRAVSLFPPHPAPSPLPIILAALLAPTHPLKQSPVSLLIYPLYIPTVIVSSFLTPLFTRHWPWSDLCLIPTSYYAFKPGASSLRRQGHAPDPKGSLQSYLRVILACPESRMIFYFLLLNLLFMLVQIFYRVGTNSLGPI